METETQAETERRHRPPTLSEQLRRLAKDILQTHNFVVVKAVPDMVAALRCDDGADALLWAGFGGAITRAVHKYLSELRRELRPGRGRGHARSGTHAEDAAPATVDAGGERDQVRGDLHFNAVPPARIDLLRRYARHEGENMLESYKIDDGRPIGEVTVREARAYAKLHRRHSRFIELLTANLPVDAVLKDYRSATDAEAFWNLAMEGAQN